MTSDATPLIFDGHNDLLLKLHRRTISVADVLNGYDGGHLDVPRAQQGGLAGGFFAVYVSGESSDDAAAIDEEMTKPEYDIPLPDPVPLDDAVKVAISQIAYLYRLEAAGAVSICRTASELAAAVGTGRMAAILHMEGAEAIDPDFNSLETFYAAGLRSLGPVWSRPTIYGHGVPFRYPSSGDTGPGLTDIGKELIKHCNRLKIMLDVSHLNEAGFDDLAALTDAPIVATHSNAYAVCPHARNLTDRQLARIRESDGLVGINFATAFLRPDGRMDPDVELDVVMRHLHHLIEKLGEDRVGFGSDFDGATIPRRISDCAGLPVLRRAMIDRGFGPKLMAKLCHENWMRVLRKTWGD